MRHIAYKLLYVSHVFRCINVNVNARNTWPKPGESGQAALETAQRFLAQSEQQEKDNCGYLGIRCCMALHSGNLTHHGFDSGRYSETLRAQICTYGFPAQESY